MRDATRDADLIAERAGPVVSSVGRCGCGLSQQETGGRLLDGWGSPSAEVQGVRRNLRILHVTPIYEPAWNAGGVVRSTSVLCRSLGRLGHDVQVVTTDSDGTGHLDVDRSGPVALGDVRVHYVHTQMPGLFRYASGMKGCLEALADRVDVVHITSFWNHPGIVAARVCRRLRIPYVVSTRGTFLPDAMAHGRLRKWAYLKLFDEKVLENAAAFHYTSCLERDKTWVPAHRRPGFVIPNGLDLGRFGQVPPVDLARRGLGLDPGDAVVGFLGRIHRIKGLDVFLRAFARACARIPNMKFLIAGPDDGHERTLQKLADDMGLGDRVVFMGPLHGVRKIDFLAALDLLTLVSWSENFGNAGAEAMAAGTPVMVSENVGLSDFVRQTGAGLVVPVQEEAMASGLVEAFADRGRLRHMGQLARETALRCFSDGAVARLMSQAYEDVLTGRRSPECRWSD